MNSGSGSSSLRRNGEPYFCANCMLVVSLDNHLRCDVCGSDAVDMAARPNRPGIPALPADPREQWRQELQWELEGRKVKR